MLHYQFAFGKYGLVAGGLVIINAGWYIFYTPFVNTCSCWSPDQQQMSPSLPSASAGG